MNADRVDEKRGHNFKDISGQTFGRLTALEVAPKRGSHIWWICRCVCGTTCVIEGRELRALSTISCGCARKTHGQCNHPLYKTWHGMIQRCTNRGLKCFPDYGGRGIKVCDRWLDFGCFLADVLPTWMPGLTLDRRENDGDYSPGNFRWATWVTQANNRRNAIRLTLGSRTMTILEWAAELGVSKFTLHTRVWKGMSDEEVLTLPIKRRTDGGGNRCA